MQDNTSSHQPEKELFGRVKGISTLLDGTGEKIYSANSWGTNELIGGLWSRSWEDIERWWDDELVCFAIGYDVEIELALHLKLISFPERLHEDYRAGRVVFLEPPALSVPGVEEALAEAVALTNEKALLFDARTCSGLSSRKLPNSIFDVRKASYSGSLPKDIAGSYLKTKALECANIVWRGDMLRAPVGEHSRLVSQKRAENLINAMMLGHMELKLPSGAGTGSKAGGRMKDVFLQSDIEITGMGGLFDLSSEVLRKCDDVMWIWQKCLHDHHLAVTLSDADIQDAKSARSLFDDIGKLIKVDDVLDLYFSGKVGADDIVGEIRPSKFSR